MQAGTRGLAGDAENRDGVGRGTVQAGDHVGAGRAGSADAHADVARVGTGVALGHVRGTFDVTSEDVIDATDFLQGRVQRVDGSPRDAERGIYTFTAHDQNGCIDCSHFAHGLCLIDFVIAYNLRCDRVYSRLAPQVNGFSSAKLAFARAPVKTAICTIAYDRFKILYTKIHPVVFYLSYRFSTALRASHNKKRTFP